MPSYTRSELVTQVSELIGDISGQQWSAARVQDRLQKAQEQFVTDTGALRSTQYASLVAGTTGYALASDTMDVVRVGVSGKAPLTKSSKFDLDMVAGGDWSSTEGSPSHYYVDLSTGYIHVWPKPLSADAGTNNLIIDYIQIPASMSGDSSTPLNALLNPYYDGIAYYAAAHLLFSSPRSDDWQKGQLMMKLYQNQVVKCREIYVDMMNKTPMSLRLGGVGRVVTNAR